MSSFLGAPVKVLDSNDASQLGMEGKFVLETAKMLLLDLQGRIVSVQKRGTVLQAVGTKQVIRADDLLGRLQDRLAR